ncbi:MAG: tetratricopeptide repeat protein [Phycisphaeraceae bacterium]|nr:tetratricopeptide repeat protein [Phycisphaeraceae bacterium]
MRKGMALLPPAAGLLLVVAGLGILFSSVSCSGGGEEETSSAATTTTVSDKAAGFIGAAACAECHQQEHESWVGSHHDAAMKPANDNTVIGDFNDSTFTHSGNTSRFFKKGGKFFVHTDGPDGKMADFEIKYTFGIEPLQQYLVEFEGGKIQALTICWDSRPKEQGGQRWYHLYPDEDLPHTDALHWTGPNFTWNHMCAECHSTDLQKNYDVKTGTYKTMWSEINVSCEACHGPGEAHKDWAELYVADPSIDKGDMGLVVRLKDEARQWVMNPETGIAERATPMKDDKVLNACARCHSRRSQIADGGDAGVPFHDNYRPSHLTEGLYFPDGQIQDEVYVWGSFVQSKMHMAGVSCVDCHDPHTARVPTLSNDLCAKCHMPSKFDTYEHHKHPPGSGGDSCINCHMPHRTYMGVDDRRDHSFRIPRPDLSLELGTPNACNQCHTEQTVEWAAENAAFWWGVDIDQDEHYGQVFHRARENQPATDAALLKLLRDEDQPAIVRGTAVIYLSRYPTRAAAQGLMEALSDKEPMVRLAAADVLSDMPIQARVGPAMKLLDDPLRSIRIEAGEALADVPKDRVSEADRKNIKAGIASYRKAQEVSADTAAATMNLGTLAYRLGDFGQAIDQFNRVLEIDPSFYPAYANLATMYADGGRVEEAIRLLDKGLIQLPKQPDLLYSKAMLFIRQRDYREAINLLSDAYAKAPGRADIAYAYAIALHDTGRPVQAIGVMKKSLETTPNDPQMLIALAQYSMQQKEEGVALQYAKEAQKLLPEDPGIAQFVRQLEGLQP